MPGEEGRDSNMPPIHTLFIEFSVYSPQACALMWLQHEDSRAFQNGSSRYESSNWHDSKLKLPFLQSLAKYGTRKVNEKEIKARAAEEGADIGLSLKNVLATFTCIGI